MPAYEGHLSALNFPRDKNTSPVAVMYTYDPNANAFSPLLATGGAIQTTPAVITGAAAIAATTDAFAVATTSTFVTSAVITKTIVVSNTGVANTAEVQIDGSVDGVTFPIALQALADVAPSASLTYSGTTYCTHVRVQIRSKVAATPTSMTVSLAGIAAQ
jgi:hypothetical protein